LNPTGASKVHAYQIGQVFEIHGYSYPLIVTAVDAKGYNPSVTFMPAAKTESGYSGYSSFSLVVPGGQLLRSIIKQIA
jgi:hypothetical protein